MTHVEGDEYQGGLRGLTPPIEKEFDDKNPQALLKVNTKENRAYTDWEIWIMTLEEVAARSLPPQSVYINQLIIEKLLIFIGNIEDADKDFERYFDVFKKFQKLSDLTISRDGNSYTVQEVERNSKVQMPAVMFEKSLELAERKQSNSLLVSQIALKIDLFRFIRRRTGYFNERGKFSLPDWLKAVTLASSPFTGSSGSYTSEPMNYGPDSQQINPQRYNQLGVPQ